MTYAESIQFLYSLRWYGTKLGLANTFRLAELAGQPQDRLRFIHVAGTNGKGSTCAMLESIYRHAGWRTGLFTSPHLVSFGERIQVDRQPITEAEIVRLVEQMKPLLARFSAEEHPTFFEVVTVMALRYFVERECELVIWETGLGGRLDATNIVTPLASVITNIGFDHQKWLGDTLAAIAGEKAGIIKPGVPVVTGAEAPEAQAVIRETSQRLRSPLVEVFAADAEQSPLKNLRLPLPGAHQRLNAAVAMATVNTLQRVLPVPESTACHALTQVRWAGRLQRVLLPGNRTLLLDGAHNIGGAEMLARTLRSDFPGAPLTLILGILADKDWPQICRALAPLARRIHLVPVHSERTAPPHGLSEPCRRANPAAEIVEHTSLAEALAMITQEPFVVLSGSLYLVGEAMELLGISSTTTESERGLNEWDAAKMAPVAPP
jgi:dihydrofolate synthase/folylpolyglutamate synthase